MPTINEYIDQLKEDRSDLVDNLETQGITGLTGDETFTQLVPQVLNISGGGEGQIIQYDVMPTPSAELEDKIIQYTGATDSTYTNGYFYKCESDHTALPEYSWVVIPVQDTPTYRYYVCGTYLVYNVTPDNYSIAPSFTLIFI